MSEDRRYPFHGGGPAQIRAFTDLLARLRCRRARPRASRWQLFLKASASLSLASGSTSTAAQQVGSLATSRQRPQTRGSAPSSGLASTACSPDDDVTRPKMRTSSSVGSDSMLAVLKQRQGQDTTGRRMQLHARSAATQKVDLS